jgi:REP element-mobilizing transposase RayT
VARPLRLEFEGAQYHLTGRGNRRERIFEDERDCARFLEMLERSLSRFRVLLHAFVLMGNHYHLLAQTELPNLGRWMHWLVTSYTVYFNRRHKRVGHLFQGRYNSIVVEAEGYLLPLSRYIHLNPVRGTRLGQGELTERRARLRAWRWSSYRGYAGLSRTDGMVSEELIFGELGGPKATCRQRYRRFMESGLVEPMTSPLEEAKWQAILGSENFQQTVHDRLSGWTEKKRREVKAVRQAGLVVPAERIVSAVARAHDMTIQGVREQRGRDQEAKGVAMTLIWDLCGYSLREIGTMFGGRDYAAVAQQVRRTRLRDQEKRLRISVAELKQICQGI